GGTIQSPRPPSPLPRDDGRSNVACRSILGPSAGPDVARRFHLNWLSATRHSTLTLREGEPIGQTAGTIDSRQLQGIWRERPAYLASPPYFPVWAEQCREVVLVPFARPAEGVR